MSSGLRRTSGRGGLEACARGILTSLLVAGCVDTTAPDVHTVREVSGPTSDTISARPSTPLTIEVGGAAGAVAREPVSFIAQAYPIPDCDQCQSRPFAFFTDASGALMPVPDSLTLATDRNARASLTLRINEKAGTFWIRVRALSHGIVDSVPFTVLPGNAVRVRAAPRDTLASIGTTFQLRGAVVDRYDNPRPEPVTYSALGSAIATGNDGQVRAGAFGLSQAVVSAGPWRDTATIGVVPAGRLSILYGSGFLVTHIDGSGRSVVPGAGTGLVYSLGIEWSPDGSAFLYAMGTYGAQRLWRQSADGGAPVRLIASPPPGLDEEAWPVFSPDGRTIYFSGRAASGAFGVWSMPSDGSSAPVPLAVACGSCVTPSPSPDGARLAYVDYSTIKILTLATGNVTVVGTGEWVRWSPDGLHFAYGLGTAEWIANVDGSDPQQVGPDDGLSTGIASWSPDGAWLLYGTNPYLEVYHLATGIRIPLRVIGMNFFAFSWAPH